MLGSEGMQLRDGSKCGKPQSQTCTHAGTHRHTEHTHACTHTHQTHMHTHTKHTCTHTAHTHIHTPAPSLVCPLYPIQPGRYENPREPAFRTHAGLPGGRDCVFSATLSYSWGPLTFPPTFSIRACAAPSALEPGGPKV